MDATGSGCPGIRRAAGGRAAVLGVHGSVLRFVLSTLYVGTHYSADSSHATAVTRQAAGAGRVLLLVSRHTRGCEPRGRRGRLYLLDEM